MGRLTVTKELNFSSAHYLENGYPGLCKNMHGHNYKLFITLGLVDGAKLDKYGFVKDFSEIKQAWKERLEEKFDHRELNESLGFQTTAENMSMFLFEAMAELVDDERVKVVKIKLYETDTSYCEYSDYSKLFKPTFKK